MTLITSIIATVKSKDEQLFKDLGARIAHTRKARGLTQVQLAERLGIAQQTLAHYEGGRVRLTIDMLLDLADELGTSVTELIGEPAHLPAKPGPASRLQQQVDAISQLPRSKQKLASDLLDTVLAR
ncbi:helix-turn-helix domain-containing protein [Burkholderia ubonensis]|uniref:helix-turn-helix domain-containing protein n=2 Tax=Burkholderia cepacia complex TaxID=87882 RepID=UPI000758BA2E|nr:helix-turn-helix transcriptional regulator [Burkholderia ubonensis]KWN16830.1 XRE family transcriptional regulator [Burkholderia ubonensis]